MCGEQITASGCSARHGGSSPRVRGTAFLFARGVFFGRFIPACAGNRGGATEAALCDAVHPRVCGEQSCLAARNQSPRGSSPRVRGTGTEAGRTELSGRFIPACAGNSRRAKCRRAIRPVHPRVCGEQISALMRSYLRRGSSPRVRGTVRAPLCRLAVCRFIPACAGNRGRGSKSLT